MKKTAIIILGCILYGVGVGVFLDPANIFTGGVTGISMILSRFFPINTGTFILLMNIPIMTTGRIVFGRKFFLLTLLGTGLSAASVFLIETLLFPFLPITNDKFVSAIAGQGILSAGLALVLYSGATTGGTDVIVKLISKKYPHITIGKIITAFDFAVITSSVIAFGNIENGIYSFVAVTVGNVILDKILYGFDEARIIIVISENWLEITQKLLSRVEVGVTLLDGYGGYTNSRKKVIFITAKKHSLPKVKKTVKETDEKSFMIVSSANEVIGNGFKP